MQIRTVGVRRYPFGSGIELLITYGEGSFATKRLNHTEVINLARSLLEKLAEDRTRLECSEAIRKSL